MPRTSTPSLAGAPAVELVEAHRLQHGVGHHVLAGGQEGGALDVDRVARIALGPRVPRAGRDRGLVAARDCDAVTEILLQLLDLRRAADRSVAGNDRVRELAHDVEHVRPRLRVALERERSDAEE